MSRQCKRCCLKFISLFRATSLSRLQIINIYVLMDISVAVILICVEVGNGGGRIASANYECVNLKFFLSTSHLSTPHGFCLSSFMNKTSAVCECKNLFIRFISGETAKQFLTRCRCSFFKSRSNYSTHFLFTSSPPTIIELLVWNQ